MINRELWTVYFPQRECMVMMWAPAQHIIERKGNPAKKRPVNLLQFTARRKTWPPACRPKELVDHPAAVCHSNRNWRNSWTMFLKKVTYSVWKKSCTSWFGGLSHFSEGFNHPNITCLLLIALDVLRRICRPPKICLQTNPHIFEVIMMLGVVFQFWISRFQV